MQYLLYTLTGIGHATWPTKSWRDLVQRLDGYPVRSVHGTWTSQRLTCAPQQCIVLAYGLDFFSATVVDGSSLDKACDAKNFTLEYYILHYYPLTNYPYRIGTPRCCIKRFFHTAPPSYLLIFLGSSFIQEPWVPILYFFGCLNLVAKGSNFCSRLQFYRGIGWLCIVCYVLCSSQFCSASSHGFIVQQRVSSGFQFCSDLPCEVPIL